MKSDYQIYHTNGIFKCRSFSLKDAIAAFSRIYPHNSITAIWLMNGFNDRWHHIPDENWQRQRSIPTRHIVPRTNARRAAA